MNWPNHQNNLFLAKIQIGGKTPRTPRFEFSYTLRSKEAWCSIHANHMVPSAISRSFHTWNCMEPFGNKYEKVYKACMAWFDVWVRMELLVTRFYSSRDCLNFLHAAGKHAG